MNRFRMMFLIGLLSTGCADIGETFGPLQKCTDSDSSYYCPVESMCCRGQCVVHSDENCTACGASCGVNEKCAQQPDHNWACVCAATNQLCSLSCCEDGCVETSSNSQHCGVCGNACPDGQSCSMGACRCHGQLIQCGNDCVDLSSNPENCGKCGLECPDANNLSLHLSYSNCVNSECSFDCLDGYRDVDGIQSNGCETSIYQCGNGILDPDEECDNNAFGNQNCQTALGPGYHGILKCHTDCSLDTSSCISPSTPSENTAVCGNGIVETGEVCDTSNLNHHSCEEKEGYKGSLKCSNDCQTLIWDDCVVALTPVCGNEKLEGDEKCDKTVFPSNIKTCAAYNAHYVAGNISCTSDCQIDTSECSECLLNQVECENQVLKKCTGKTWETTECKGNTPICSVESGKCIAEPPTQTTFSTDFEWLPDALPADTNYTTTYPMPNTVGFKLNATGRINLINADTSYAIDGKGIILKTNDKPQSGIEVTDLTNGIGTIEFDVYGWDSAKVYINHGNAQRTENTSDRSAPQIKRTHVTFTINSATDTKFTIKSGKRVTIDNLLWTSNQ